MAKGKQTMAGSMLNRFAVQRHLRSAQQLHDEGFLSDAELARVIKSIDGRRQPGWSNGGEEIENAVANLDAAAGTA